MEKKRKGWNCKKVEDGTQHCTRIEQDKDGKKLATGTEVGIGVDQETCEPVFSGDVNDMMDDDSEDIAKIAGRMTKKCQENKNRGL